MIIVGYISAVLSRFSSDNGYRYQFTAPGREYQFSAFSSDYGYGYQIMVLKSVSLWPLTAWYIGFFSSYFSAALSQFSNNNGYPY